MKFNNLIAFIKKTVYSYSNLVTIFMTFLYKITWRIDSKEFIFLKLLPIDTVSSSDSLLSFNEIKFQYIIYTRHHMVLRAWNRWFTFPNYLIIRETQLEICSCRKQAITNAREESTFRSGYITPWVLVSLNREVR